MSSSVSNNLDSVYRDYIAAILDHDLDSMSKFVSEEVVHNGNSLGLEGYKVLLRKNIMDTDVHIDIKRLVTDAEHVAALLIFTTKASTKELVGIKLNGQSFSYAENVFYDFRDGKIVEVHSLFDIDTVRAHANSAWEAIILTTQPSAQTALTRVENDLGSGWLALLCLV